MFLKNRKRLWFKYRFQRSKLYFLLGLGFLFVFGLILLVSFNLNQNKTIVVSTGKGTSDSEMAKVFKLFDVSEVRMQEILAEGCPIIFRTWDVKTLNKENDFRKALTTGLAYITDLNTNDPLTYFKAQIAALAIIDLENTRPVQGSGSTFVSEEEEDFYLETPPELENWQFEFDNTKPVELSKDPVVLVYNTHNAETYFPTDGKSKLEGKNAGIAKVAQTLTETLEKAYGLKTIKSDTIHDFPDFARSYIKSLETAQKLLKANPTIQVVFDVHRDAGFKEKSTTTAKINGKNVAKIMMVVGTEHQGWQKNLAFAKKLEAKANELYPDLVRDIRIANNRRYNQHIHPNSLILEIGSDLNTLSEAQYSVTLFAKVVSEVIKEK